MRNRKDKLKEKSSTLFLMGLTCAMAFSLVSFEWKNFESKDYSLGLFEDHELMDEEMIHVIPPEPKPELKPKSVAVKTKETLVKLIVDNNTKLVEKKDLIIDPELDIKPIEEIDTVEVDGPDVVKPYEAPDQRAEFPGGLTEMYKYLNKMEYPDEAVEVGITGQVYLKFIVRKNGKIDNIEVMRGIGGGCDEEAVKMLKNSPTWMPGLVKGQAVDSYFNLPIQFSLEY